MSFPITCTACNKTFTVSDEIYEKKVSGRVVTIKCKACGQGIRVDGTKSARAIAAPAAEPEVATEAAIPAEAAQAGNLWAVDYPDGQDREFTTAEVLAALARGAIEGGTLVWQEGMAEWLELRQMPTFAGELASLEAKRLAAQVTKAPAPVHKARAAMPTVTGIGALPPPPPPPPARLAPPPPAPPARAPAPIAASTEPEATPPLPPSVVKAFSQPPQPAFPQASALPGAPALATDDSTVDWPKSKNRTPLVVAGLAAIAAVVVGVVVLGGKEDAPAPTAIAAVPVTTTPVMPDSAANREPAAPAAPAAPASTATSSAGSAEVTADPGATPGAGFAELFAAGARKAETKGASVAPSERFDPAATKTALSTAASQATACKESGGPTGKVTVVVTFDPSGKVSSATVGDAPFAGTPTGNCVAAAMKRATIAPFSGLPGTVSKSLVIQ